MAISIFDLFTIGIGPSSSHTVGPMRAARRFAQRLPRGGRLSPPGRLARRAVAPLWQRARLRIELFGSLAMTGKGHGTDRAVLLGLEGETPEEVDPAWMPRRVAEIRAEGGLRLLGLREVPFDEKEDLVWNRKQLLPLHSNGMQFAALDAAGGTLDHRTYYSVGGGFVVNEEDAGHDRRVHAQTPLPSPLASGAELLRLCRDEG